MSAAIGVADLTDAACEVLILYSTMTEHKNASLFKSSACCHDRLSNPALDADALKSDGKRSRAASSERMGRPDGASLNFLRMVDGCQTAAGMLGCCGTLEWLRAYRQLLRSVPPLSRLERSLLHGVLLSLLRTAFCTRCLTARQLCEIVHTTNATFAALERVPGVDIGGVADARVAEALRFMEMQHQDSDLSVAMVARHVNLSFSRFEHLFVQHIGMRCSRYLAQVRISKVAELLMSSCLTVKEIAAQTGYARVSALDHQFRRYIGLSPTTFRKRDWAQNSAAESDQAQSATGRL